MKRKDNFKVNESDTLLHEIFEKQASISPYAEAIVSARGKLNYLQLSERSNQIAHFLRGKQVKINSLVGIFMEKGWEQSAAILGIMKSGAAYLPISIYEPKERLEKILAQSEIKILLTTDEYKNTHQWPDHLQIFPISHETLKKFESNKLCSLQKSEDLAYVIFTSGSTGTPKGVAITHQGAMNTILDINAKFEVNNTDRILSLSALNFDLSVYDFFGPLFCGACLILPQEKDSKDPLAWSELIKKEKISIWNSVPALMQLLVDSNPSALPSLRLVLLSGDWIPLHLTEKIRQLNKNEIQVIGLGGTTETSIWSTFYPIKKIDKDWKSIPYGKPLRNQEIYIFDENLNQLSEGQTGEIHIGGLGLAKKYWGDEAKTNERFIHTKNNKRVYKTGDLGRVMKDGNIEFLGRIDHQVKVNGFRIELGEIEKSLNTFCKLNNSIAAVYENKIAVYFLSNEVIHKEILRQFLKKLLPEYMVPTYYIRLAHLPLSNNGKIDRKLLPKPTQNDLVSLNIYAEPSTEQEKTIASIWKTALKINRLSIHDSFFEIGGDSLSAVRVLNQVNKKLQTNFDLKDLFINPTIYKMLNSNSGLNQKSLAPIVPVSQEQEIPVSLEQKSIFMHEKFTNDRLIYKEIISIHLHKYVDVISLEKAVNVIMERHDILRVRFYIKDNVIFQKFAPHKKIKIDIVDINNKDEKLSLEILNKKVKKAFDLEKENPVQFIFIKSDKKNPILSVLIHHLITDGVSIYNIFLSELETYYKKIINNQKFVIDRPSLQYKDFCMWQEKNIKEIVSPKSFAYWKNRLSGFAPLQFPTKFIKKPTMSRDGDIFCLRIPSVLASALRNIAKARNTTLFNILLSSFILMNKIYSQQEDVLIYTISGGRNTEEKQNIMGLFMNAIPFRNDLSDNPKFTALLDHVKNNLINDLSHEIPYYDMMRQLNFTEELEKMVKVCFVLEPIAHKNEFDWTPSQLELHAGRTKYDLTMELDIRGEDVYGRVEYSTELFDKNFIEIFVNHYLILLEKISYNPENKISEFSVLTEKEENVILKEWNQTKAFHPRHKCIHHLFEEQAEKSPHAIAVSFEGHTLTYKALNQRSNILAHYLINQGIKTETLIGIAVEKSLEMIIGMFAILKAGGAYVPIDPAYPKDRIQYIIEDSAIEILLTQSSLAEILPKVNNLKKNVFLDQFDFNNRTEHEKNPAINLSNTNLAYVIYTSGSTGKPKGVLIEHSGLLNLTTVHKKVYKKADPSSARVLQLASFSFDAATYEIIPTLTQGDTLFLAKKEDILPGETIEKFITEKQITHITLSPSALANFTGKFLPSLKVISTCGEACPLSLAQKISSNYRFLNLYGPTEATIWATYAEYKGPAQRLTIGKHIDNYQAYILDKYLQPVPMGVTGEIYLGGVGLARGYLNRPELTAEKFIPHPFSNHSEERLYKTGDLARYLSNGEIEYLGRTDQQVKVRGFRIELGEIEAVLASFPGVQNVATIVREDMTNEKCIVAYLEFENYKEGKENFVELRNYVKKQLPIHMVPSYFHIMEHLPLTPNQKIDRKNLPKPQQEKSKNYSAPKTKIEKNLAHILANILNVKKIGLHDNFFDLGGNSLLTIQAAAQAKTLGMTLTPWHIFEAPTVAGLAKISKKYKPIIAFNKAGKQSPLFVVHPGGYGTEAYAKFAKYVTTQQPIYAFENHNLYSNEDSLDSIEKIAQKYIQLMKQIQPYGPYHIGGWSQGGVIAYEMAVQLEQEGVDKTALYLIDPFLYSKKVRNEKIKKLNEMANMPNFKKDYIWLEQMANIKYNPASYYGKCLFFKATKFKKTIINDKEIANIFTEYELLSKEKNNGFGNKIKNIELNLVATDHRSLLVNEISTKKIATTIEKNIKSFKN